MASDLCTSRPASNAKGSDKEEAGGSSSPTPTSQSSSSPDLLSGPVRCWCVAAPTPRFDDLAVSVRRQVRVALRRGERLVAEEGLDVVQRDASCTSHDADVCSMIRGGNQRAALPPILAMAGEYEVSVPTVRKALAVLKDEGLVIGVGEYGTFVAEE
jgi:hypothetical protein